MHRNIVDSAYASERQATLSAAPAIGNGTAPDLVVLSHLRWDFVWQRPQHLLQRFAKHGRVFVIEEPVATDGQARMRVEWRQGGVVVAVPEIPREQDQASTQRRLLDALLREQGICNYVLWFYTPMALEFAGHLQPAAIVYDCMDELSAFKGAPPRLRALEDELFRRADLVFTGGQSLYEAKRARHPSVHAFPSSVDREHFARARERAVDPEDQRDIARPRIGFFGVIDERMDLDLLDAVAAARPDWQLVMIGPVVKIDPATLPRRPNLHFLGKKEYALLPDYLAGWDVAMLPFALNESTRFISPTKTPEYLAAGKPVVSTPVRDVVRPYGEQGLAAIASTPSEFVNAVEGLLSKEHGPEWIEKVDRFLSSTSWDRTAERMRALLSPIVKACASAS